MMRSAIALLCALCWAGQVLAMVGVAPNPTQPLDLIVQYRSQPLAARAAPRDSRALDAIRPGLRTVHYASEAALNAALQAMRHDPNVLSVHRAVRVTATFTPNDPLYSAQWDKTIQHLEVADAVETGQSPVLILVVDTAWDCTSHPDLAPNCRQDLSRNFISDPGIFFHGYHVAGIAAASVNNALDIAGTAGTAQVAFARFLDHNGSGSTADALTAWNYAIQLENAGWRVVVNNSWGAPTNDTSLQSAATAMKAAGIVNVAAAGNNSTDNCTTPFYPAVYPEVLSVAATDSNDALASFSNLGQCVWLGAPGVNVTSLSNNAAGYQVASGTSMASPQVAGAAALVLSQNPTLTPDQVKAQIEAAALPKGLNVSTGKRLDLANLLQPAKPGFRLSSQCPAPAVVDVGVSMSCDIDALGTGGFTSPVALSCSGIPGATCTFNPPSVSPGGTSAMTVTPGPSTPVPQTYVLTVSGADSTGAVTNSTQHYVQVYPPGTATFNYSTSTPTLWFGICSNPVPAGTTCPPQTSANYRTSVSSQIAVPDNNQVLHLSGSANISWQGPSPTVTIKSPKGTVYTIPLPTQLVTPNGADYPFDTDVFDGEPANGTWTATITLTGGYWWGHFSNWKMSMLAAPINAPPPPNFPTVDFPTLNFNWTSQNAQNCTASGAWSGSQPLNGSQSVSEPYGTYALTCTNSAGSTKKTLTIGVQ